VAAVITPETLTKMMISASTNGELQGKFWRKGVRVKEGPSAEKQRIDDHCKQA
jgi:hypothetical protein